MFGLKRNHKQTAAMQPDNSWFRGDPLVELNHIDFSYKDYGDADDETSSHAVLRDFSLTVERGERVALLGPNGSGKTTLMRIINALEFPDSGEYRFGGTPVVREEVEAKNSLFAKALHQRIGFVFQSSDTQLFCPSVEEEIAFGPLQKYSAESMTWWRCSAWIGCGSGRHTVCLAVKKSVWRLPAACR